MRRLLALALTAAPLAASAQLAGEIWFDGAAEAPTMNLAQCNGAQTSDTFLLGWTVTMVSGSLFVTGGEYRVFAASADPGTASPICHTSSDTGAVAAKVATVPTAPDATTESSSASVTTQDLRTAAGYDCSADKVIYVCVAWYSDPTAVDSAFEGYAKGQVKLTVTAPNAPTVTYVAPGDEALVVDVTDNGGTTTATSWRAKAVAADGVAHYSGWSVSTSGIRIDGLQNLVPYTVTAFARSDAGNESIESDPYGSEVAPQVVRDAWDVYKDAGGRDAGGCGAGPAGLLALLGASALLRLRRRS